MNERSFNTAMRQAACCVGIELLGSILLAAMVYAMADALGFADAILAALYGVMFRIFALQLPFELVALVAAMYWFGQRSWGWVLTSTIAAVVLSVVVSVLVVLDRSWDRLVSMFELSIDPPAVGYGLLAVVAAAFGAMVVAKWVRQ